MLAVANPDIPHEQFAREYSGPYVYDRDLRSEGYGIVRVDHDEGAFVVECWPRDADPANPDGSSSPGLPYRLTFDEAGGAGT